MGEITRDVDGDTFVAQATPEADPKKVRIPGIQIEESVSPDESKNTARGRESSEFAKVVLPEGSEVEVHNFGLDFFGRDLSSVSKVVNGVELDYGLIALDQGHSYYHTKYGEHRDPLLHEQYATYFSKYAPYQYGGAAPTMSPEDVTDMQRGHERFQEAYNAVRNGEGSQEEFDQAAYELYKDPEKAINYRKYLNDWNRRVTTEDYDGSDSYAFRLAMQDNLDLQAQYNRAVKNGHLYRQPNPELEPDFWRKGEASLEMFHDVVNFYELEELWTARAADPVDIGVTRESLIVDVPPQYHADLIEELEVHGQLAAKVRREQTLEDIDNDEVFANMEWYAQIGYGIPAFLLSPTTLLAGAGITKVGTGATMATRAWAQRTLVNVPYGGVQLPMMAKLATGGSTAASWLVGGAAESVVANFPRLAADHTYTARDYALDVAVESIAAGGLGAAWHGVARPVAKKFGEKFGKDVLEARRAEAREIEAKIERDSEKPTAVPVTAEAQDLEGTSTGAANRATRVIHQELKPEDYAEVKLSNERIKLVDGVIEELKSFLDRTDPEGRESGNFDLDLSEISRENLALAKMLDIDVTEGGSSLEFRIGRLENVRADLRKGIADIFAKGKSGYVPLEAIDDVSTEGFTAVSKTLLKAFPEKSEMHWLLKRHNKLLNSEMEAIERAREPTDGWIPVDASELQPPNYDPESAVLGEALNKLNADILKLAANYPTGKIPKGVRKQIRALTHEQRDFKTQNVLNDLLQGNNIKSPLDTLARYVERLSSLEVWQGDKIEGLTANEFFGKYGTPGNWKQQIADSFNEEDTLNLNMGDVPPALSYLNDVIEVNKMAQSMEDPEFTALVEKLNGMVGYRLDQMDLGIEVDRYRDTTESFGKSVPMSPQEILEQIKKEGIPFGPTASPAAKKKFKARRKELQQHGRAAVSKEVQDVNLIGPKNDPIDVGLAGTDKIQQPLLPRAFQEVEKTSAYTDPSVENVEILRKRLRSDILKPLGLLEIKGKAEKAAQVKRMAKIESSIKAGKLPQVLSHMESLGDTQTAVQVVRVAKTLKDEQTYTAKLAKENGAEVEAVTVPDITEETLDPTSVERSQMTPKERASVEAQLTTAHKERTKASVTKLGDAMTNFVASGAKRLGEIGRGPASKLDFLGRLQSGIVADLGSKFQNGKLTSLEYIGYYLTEIGKGYGGNARRTHSAALIRDFESRASEMQILPSYAKTMDALAISKGEGHVGRSRAQNEAGADNKLVDEFNRDVFKLSEALRRGDDVSHFGPELRGFMDEWDTYMDYNHGRLVDAGIEGFTKARKVKHYIPRVWEHGAIRGAITKHGRDKLDTLFTKAYRSHLEASGEVSNIDAAAKDLAKGHVDFLVEQAERARRGKAIPDGYEPAIDSRARQRRDIDIRAEVDGLSILDLLDTEVAGIATKYSNRMAGWVGLSKATKGTINSQVDIDVLRANMVAEGVEKGIDTTKYEQYYDDLINLMMGRPTRGGLLKELRQLKDLTVQTRMGGLGTAQLIETGQVITRSLLNFTSSDEVVKTAFKRAGVDPNDSLLIRDIQNISKITDDIEWLDRQSVHLDQAEIEEAHKARQFSLWLANKATFGSAKATGSRLLGKTTGYNMIRKLQSRVVQSSFTLDVLKHFKDGTGKMGNRRMADLGLTNSLGEDEALSKAIKEHVKYDADGNIESINFDKWDVDAREKFQYAMIRDEAQQIQRTLVGELPPWMNKPMMGLLFQFREMPLVAHNKQLGRSLAFADKEAVMGVMANASMAGMVRWAKFAALGTAVAAITGETVRDPTTEQMSVSKYITQFGIYADAYDLVLGAYQVEETDDAEELALRQVPVLGLMKDYFDAFGGADDGREMIEAAQGLTPLGNTALGEMIYTQMLETFGDGMSLETESHKVRRHEGSVQSTYKDTEGNLTGGVGHLLTADEKKQYPLGAEIPEHVTEEWFARDMAEAEQDALALLDDGQPEEVVDIVTNMAFNMGRSRLSGFRKMFAAISERDYERAADEMLDSKWAKQVKGRAEELAQRMENVTEE